jgi:transcription elongation factor Elf1
MVTFECPWCAEPAVLDVTTFATAECEHCAIEVEIAPDPVHSSLEQAA